LDNLAKIRSHNDEAAKGIHTYKKAMNEFGDLTGEEFKRIYTGFNGPRNEYLNSRNRADLSTVAPPESVDWVAKGAVGPVKSQAQCGACWAFSSTGSLEGAWFVAKGQLVSLSEQYLIDCSREDGNNGCEGGLMNNAFEFAIKAGGLCSEADYPYLMSDKSTCHNCTFVASISSYSQVDQTEEDLMKAVSITPVSVGIEADQDAFQFYSSGVMSGECGTKLDHGVVAVGYGTLNGVDYWKLKNSWGTTWGVGGFGMIERGKKQKGGQCGVLLAASYPVV